MRVLWNASHPYSPCRHFMKKTTFPVPLGDISVFSNILVNKWLGALSYHFSKRTSSHKEGGENVTGVKWYTYCIKRNCWMHKGWLGPSCSWWTQWAYYFFFLWRKKHIASQKTLIWPHGEACKGGIKKGNTGILETCVDVGRYHLCETDCLNFKFYWVCCHDIRFITVKFVWVGAGFLEFCVWGPSYKPLALLFLQMTGLVIFHGRNPGLLHHYLSYISDLAQALKHYAVIWSREWAHLFIGQNISATVFWLYANPC